jgi:hypothetical protein
MFKKKFNPKIKGEGNSTDKPSKTYPSKKKFYPESKPAGRTKKNFNFKPKSK